MRERLTVAFVAIALVLLLGTWVERSFTVRDQLEDHEHTYVAWEASTVAQVLSEEQSGTPVSPSLDELQPLTPPGAEIDYSEPGKETIVSAGRDYDETDDGGTVAAPVQYGPGVLTLRRDRDDSISIYGVRSHLPLAVVLILLLVFAGAIGYIVARALSEPFRQLALAAAALGRGRFDLDLPRTRVPEARSIASALESSASQLKDRLEREREFGQHTSHVLRTPLTSLRLHLEELIGDPELSPEARGSALDCLKAVGKLNQVAGELVDLSGGGVLVAGAALPLRDVATSVAQRWADVLDRDGGRRLTAAVEGDIELMFTPGPIEQVLDLVLSDTVLPDEGDVRVVFEGDASRLQIDIIWFDVPRVGPPVRRAPMREVSAAVVSTVEAMGGRQEPTPHEPGLRVYLPRR